MQTYKIKPWLVWLIVVIGIAAPCALGYFIISDYNNLQQSGQLIWFVLGWLALLVFFALGVWDGFGSYLQTNDESILYKGIFYTRQLYINQIEGFEEKDDYIFIIPKLNEGKKIKIHKYYKNSFELREWIYENLTDLDEQRSEEEMQTFLTNESLGEDADDRMQKLVHVFKVAKVFNWSSGILAVWLFFYPYPLELVIVLTILCTVASWFVLFYYKGYIKLDEDTNNSKFPNIFFAIFFAPLALLIRTLTNFTLVSYNSIWIPLLLCAGFASALVIWQTDNLKKAAGSIFFYFVFFLVLLTATFYAMLVSVNCTFDQSTPQYFNARVQDKHINNGKHTSYYLTLSKWGPMPEEDDAEVASEIYEVTEPGDTVTVFMKNGLLGLSWFDVMYPNKTND